MPKGKYIAADVAPDPNTSGGMPNAGPMGKYSAADVADAPPPTDDDTLTNIIGGAASRAGSYITGALPHSLSDIVAGPMSGIGIARTQFENIKRSAEDVFSGEPNRVGRGVVQGVAPGMGTGSLYDMAASGKTPEAVGAGGVDALALMLPELEKGAGAIADSASHPIIRGAGRVIRDFDITKPFKSVGDNVVAPAAEKFSQWWQNRGRPQLQSPLDPSAGVRVAPGAPVAQPRVPSPAEDLISAIDNESAVRRAPDTKPAPPQVRVKHVQEGIQSPLEPGTGTVAPRQFGDAPVSADASDIPTLADEMVGPLEQGQNEMNLARPSHLRGPYDVGGPPQPLEDSLAALDPMEQAIRKDWLTKTLAEHKVNLEDLRAPNGNFGWSPSVVKAGEPFPEWDRAGWQDHVLENIDNLSMPHPPNSVRAMQPTADMNTGGGGANYSADDLANLISKHNIPPAPGEVVGGTPLPKTVRVFHGTDFNNIANIGREGIKPGPSGGPWFTTHPEDAISYGQPAPFSEGPQVSRPSIIQADIPEGYINKDLSDLMGEDEHGNPIYNHELDDLKVDPDQITGVRHLQHRGYPEVSDDAAILQAIREDLDAHGRNALHEESTNFAARNKVGKGKTGKAGYGFNRKLPEAE